MNEPKPIVECANIPAFPERFFLVQVNPPDETMWVLWDKQSLTTTPKSYSLEAHGWEAAREAAIVRIEGILKGEPPPEPAPEGEPEPPSEPKPRLEVNWSLPQYVQQSGKKKRIMVETALLDDHPDRFVLFQTNAGMIPTMWSLWDRGTETQHFLYASGWEHARLVAAERIERTLNAPPPAPAPKKKPKRTKKARRATRQ